MKGIGMPSLKTLMISSLVLVLILTDVAQAYLDPGTGSFLIQFLLAGLFGVILSIRIFWGSVKSGLLRLLGKKKDEPNDKPYNKDESSGD